jgi:hypothetical protein
MAWTDGGLLPSVGREEMRRSVGEGQCPFCHEQLVTFPGRSLAECRAHDQWFALVSGDGEPVAIEVSGQMVRLCGQPSREDIERLIRGARAAEGSGS